jgi:hypothetical protein
LQFRFESEMIFTSCFLSGSQWCGAGHLTYRKKRMENHITTVKHKPLLFMGKDLRCVNTHEINRNRAYIVKNLLLAGQVSILCGAPNTGKSAVIAAAASHIAMGRDFAGHRASRAGVLYIAAEDPDGIADRAYPYLRAGIRAASPFHIHPHPVNLCAAHEVAYFIEEAAAYQTATGCDGLFIVIDTLNLCIGDGDENSARDMGQAMGSAQRIARATGAHVMIIHHTAGHDGSRPRGSTAMEGNVDTLLTLQRADEKQPQGVVFISQRKQRSVRKGAPIAFKIEGFDAGTDSEGDPLTVPMAIPFQPTSSLVAAKKKPAAKSCDLNERYEDVKRVLRDLAASNPNDEWFDATTIRGHTGKPFNTLRDNTESHSRTVRKVLEALIKSGDAERNDAGRFRLKAGQTSQEDQRAGTTLH